MTKLITYAYLKKETDISQIVDDSKLDNPIKNACDQLRSLIGPGFYNEIVSQIITTPQSLTTANNTFFDPYVKQFLAWKAYEFYIIKANTFEGRTGVRLFQEENSIPAPEKTMGEYIAMAKRQSQMYKEMMIDFLKSAKRVSNDSYPLYTASCGSGAGSGFGISAISKTDTVSYSINNKIVNQEG